MKIVLKLESYIKNLKNIKKHFDDLRTKRNQTQS